MIIQPARRLLGRLRMPGDKSISHRAALLSALARGRARIDNFSTSEDCARTLECLARLGVSIDRDGASVLIEGAGIHGLSEPRVALDCGNSGSTMRLLAGVLAGQEFASKLTGDHSLLSRPMKRIIEPLERMGARIESNEGHAPLSIQGCPSLAAIRYEMPVASAQVKSCIMLAGLLARGRTSIIEACGPTRDHTERMLRWLGLSVSLSESLRQDVPYRTLTLEGPATFAARDINVPGDISSASFFIAAASLLSGSELEINALGLNPTRAQIIQTMQQFGAEVELDEVSEICHEPVGTVRVKGRRMRGPLAAARSNMLRGALIPQLIDELPVLAVLGTQVDGGLTIRDASELRVKESDRIAATVGNLRAMGTEVEEFEDGLRVAGPVRLKGAMLDSLGDHRIAMAFTVAALLAEGESELAGAECVGVSFPEFFSLLETVVER
jgi:3-phosphoshikimate 1-carboxyvinyltransferase